MNIAFVRVGEVKYTEESCDSGGGGRSGGRGGRGEGDSLV